MTDNSFQGGNGWAEYKKLVLQKLKESDDLHETFELHRTEVHGRITKLETKAGMFGAAGGAVAGTLLTLLLKILT